MTEFARTVTKNSQNSNRIQFRKIAGILVVCVITAIFVFWFSLDKKPEVQGSLNVVTTIESTGKNRINGAKGIALDSNGNIYVADSRNDRIVVFSSKGKFRRIIGGKDDRSGQKIKYPTALAVDDTRIVVSSYGSGEVLIYSKKGKLLDVLPHKEDKINLPKIYALALTTDSNGNIYVADGKNNSIHMFDSKGKLQLVFGETGFQEGQMRYVNGLAVDENRRLLIALESGNLRVSFYNLEGKFLQHTTYKENGQQIFVTPQSLAFDPVRNTLYIADPILDKILKVKENGEIIAKSPGGILNYPRGLALGPDGYLYVVGREDGKISVLNP